MPLTTVLFDMDGTLLPMDQDVFIKDYFGRLAKKLAPYGYELQKLIEAVWAGMKAMVKNTGIATNEEAFWVACDAYLGCEASKDAAIHADFYRNEFNEVKAVCGFEPMAVQIVHSFKEKGIRVVLATNPLFPAVATENRIRWAGLQPEDFEYYTILYDDRFTVVGNYKDSNRTVTFAELEAAGLCSDFTALRVPNKREDTQWGILSFMSPSGREGLEDVKCNMPVAYCCNQFKNWLLLYNLPLAN